MLSLAQLPWKFGGAGNEVRELPETTAQIMQTINRRRASTMTDDGEKPPEDIPSILLRIEKDLKSQISELDQKLERLCGSGAADRAAARAAVLRRHARRLHPCGSDAAASHLSSVSSDDLGASASGQVQPAQPDPPNLLPTGNVLLPPGQPSWLHLPGESTPRRATKDPSEVSTTKDGSFAATQVSWRQSYVSHKQTTRIQDMIRQKLEGFQGRRSPRSQAVWRFLEEPESSRAAHCFSWLMLLLVASNVALSLLQAQEVPLLDGLSPVIFHLLFDCVCLVEVSVRFAVSPQRCTFFGNFFNWVDLLSGLATGLRLARLLLSPRRELVRELDDVLHCTLPVVWLLKLLRNFDQFHLLLNAFVLASEALPVLLFTLTIIVLCFASAIYMVEPRENLEAFPRSIWFTIVTMMTVGYGDIVPMSSSGHIIVSALMVGSQLYMAIPLGIVGGSFSRVWEDRDRLLLIRRTRLRLRQWGYTPNDLLELFFFYDTQKMGELDIQDFTRMMGDMRLALTAERLRSLFASLDSDGSGRIDCEEFVATFYPGCLFPFPRPAEIIVAAAPSGEAALRAAGSA